MRGRQVDAALREAHVVGTEGWPEATEAVADGLGQLLRSAALFEPGDDCFDQGVVGVPRVLQFVFVKVRGPLERDVVA